MIREWLEAAAQERPAAPALSSVGSGETLDFRGFRDRVAAEALAFSVGEWVPMSPRRTGGCLPVWRSCGPVQSPSWETGWKPANARTEHF